VPLRGRELAAVKLSAENGFVPNVLLRSPCKTVFAEGAVSSHRLVESRLLTSLSTV